LKSLSVFVNWKKKHPTVPIIRIRVSVYLDITENVLYTI